MKNSTPEQKTELKGRKQTEIHNWLRHGVVEAASRAGVHPGGLMRMRWVVTTKDSGDMKARLVVQGITDPALGRLRTESPTCSRRARQVFLALTASLRLKMHRGDVKAAFLQGDEETRTVLVECAGTSRISLSRTSSVRTSNESSVWPVRRPLGNGGKGSEPT